MSDAGITNSDTTKENFLVVGIGASAGGVQALQEFFTNTEPDSGIAYIVILHLSPDHDSMLAEILQLATKMPVTQVNESTTIKPDHVYVVPPNKSLTIQKQQINISPIESIEERRAPVDIFFRSLADAFGPRAVGVVLSGTGANGSMGIKRIKENGGIILAQDPMEAQFNEMPNHTIETDLADNITKVALLPTRIREYRLRFDSTQQNGNLVLPEKEQAEQLREIFKELRTRTGHDFSNYKKATMVRRIERRMNVRNLSSLEDYSRFLKNEKDEAAALLKDLLISVTNFFRDKDAFDFLEKDIIPRLLKGKTSMDSIRVWVTGCATGEEAYSIAMLLMEQLTGVPESPQVQIFATDIDDAAIAVAREGIYTLNDAADVSPERLNNFFIKEGNDFRIKRELRELVLFANHNLIKDPPFSHLDLATCRNMLIYLNQAAQKRALETLHFALKPAAFLFIGSSESIESSADLYLPVSKEFHIFQTRSVVSRSFPLPDKFSSPQSQDPASESAGIPKKSVTERLTYNDLHQRLLEQYAPPSIVVNQDFDIVHLSERAGRYLQILGGEPSNNLLKLIRPELRLELRSGLYQAVRQQTNLEIQHLKLTDPAVSVNIHIRPVLRKDDVGQGFILIIIQEAGDVPEEDEAIHITGPSPVAEHLEDELMRSKVQLRNSVEQYEVQTEELKASNEELQAINEELRSAAEELETSKEELQSINEELVTVNQELKVKIDELSQSNNNFQNLINSTDIGTIFLDRSYLVKLFTPSVRQIFNLISHDIGRSLTDISSRLKEQDVLKDAAIVMERLVTIEREVETTDDQFFMMRLLPYRTTEDHINGVVITFVNITPLKKAEQSIRKTEQHQRFLLELSDRLSIMGDPDSMIRFVLKAIGEQLAIDRAVYMEINHISGARSIREQWSRYDLEEVDNTDFENEWKGLDQLKIESRAEPFIVLESSNDQSSLLLPLKTEGKLEACFYFLIDKRVDWDDQDYHLVKEVSERTWNTIQKIRAEQQRRRNEEHLRFVMDSIADYAIITLDTRGVITGWNPGAEKMFGFESMEAIGQHFEMIFTPEDRVEDVPQQEITTAMEYGRADDERWHLRKDNTRFYVSGVTNRLRQGREGLVKIARDMTAGKILEQQKDQFIGIASHELKTPVTSIKAYAEVLRDMFLDANDIKSAELMNRLDGQVDRLTILISHLLDTTRIAEGQLIFQPEEFDLNQLINDQVADLQSLTSRHNLIVREGSIEKVTADRERIGQVINNLLTNAIKYTPDGGDILISSTNLGNAVQVSVTDPGIGMTPDSTGKIFDRFDRTNNPKIQTYPGLGLGLYISSEIVKRHNGKIWVESRPGKGSTFYFTIPYKSHELQ
ncbi:MAG: CheR family methyltransferase [Chitinophagaceae bacterium]